MKFLIQKFNGLFMHDFTLGMYHAVNYLKWLDPKSNIRVKYIDCDGLGEWEFKEFHRAYVPIGTVDFINVYFDRFYGHKLSPINVPKDLYYFAHREIRILNHMDFEDLVFGKYFIKSNTKVKGHSDLIHIRMSDELPDIPPDEYQVSDIINIESEWRCFVYQRELVGVQHYSGDFKLFPDINIINGMIARYSDSPIAYTLDIGIDEIQNNFVIEVHDFYSCGLYGFNDYGKLPYMHYKWFNEYLKKHKLYEYI